LVVIGMYDESYERGRADVFRFHFMWEFLGLPWQDIELLPKGSQKGRANL
jgi:hypothetical protein